MLRAGLLVLVKIDNRPEARPQVGLNDADIVFEELTEGGITRFLAVYQSRLPPIVGPIRSVRPVDPALVSPLRGVFAYSGGTPPNVAAIERHRSSPSTKRERARQCIAFAIVKPPHNLFGTPTQLRVCVTKRPRPAPAVRVQRHPAGRSGMHLGHRGVFRRLPVSLRLDSDGSQLASGRWPDNRSSPPACK